MPSPSIKVYDDTLDLLAAAVVNEPWKCNVSGWGGVVWTRCVAPDTPRCKILPMAASTPSPSSTSTPRQSIEDEDEGDDSRRLSEKNDIDRSSSTPSPSYSCRQKVALASMAQGWCNEEAVCNNQCTNDTGTRRVLDMYVNTNKICPQGDHIQPSNIAMAWLIAACVWMPTMCLSTWRMFVLILRSRLHWKNYWVGCSAFSALIFKWPVGRVIFSGVACGIAILLLALRKFDKIGVEQEEEDSLLGIDMFVGWCWATATYLWFVAVTSIPLALGQRAMMMELPPPRKKKEVLLEENETKVISLESTTEERERKEKEERKRKEEEEPQRLDDSMILKRLGMRSRHVEKSKCLQKIRRNWRTVELRKYEALQDVKSPMKPSDRIACSHSLFKQTKSIQSFLYLILLSLSCVPAVFSLIFQNPSPFFWSLGLRSMHFGYAGVLVLWWMRFSAAIPSVKRVLAAGVIRPPGDPGKPTNGSKRALNEWRDRVNEARGRLTPVLDRFTRIESWTRVLFTSVIGIEICLGFATEVQEYLPVIEPLRWILTGPVWFVILWILPPMPRRTGKSVYKTRTLVELMQPVKRAKNPQDGSGGYQSSMSTNQYVGSNVDQPLVALLTDDLEDTDTREAAMLRLKHEFDRVAQRCPGMTDRDVRALLHRFDVVAKRTQVLAPRDFVEVAGTAREDAPLMMRWFNSLPRQQLGGGGSGGGDGGGGGGGESSVHVHVGGGGVIHFLTHACAMYDMCTATRPRLAMLVFEMYDADHGGDLDRDEIRVLLREVNHKSGEIAISEEDIDRFDADRGGTVDTEEFAIAVKSFPALLRPAYTLQRKLRETTLSLRRWEQIAASGAKEQAQMVMVNYENVEEEELEIIEIG